ncbi:primosomal protein N' [Streptobacillus felis]|uniref:Replication restart protein PriA n=1 Tax=Streptobacillus felis TaxID=1384509 RepID=A0A7Z0T7G4_9FUSO|nr:primosomal protein N' [Streptobacillus felis]NYV28266.1 primosomal protein N' [Streptobacillus felis]
MFYQIYVKKHINTYTYESDFPLTIGSFVEINFKNKDVVGVVIRESKKEEIGNFKIKKINRCLDDIVDVPESILKIAKFINSYYITDFHASFKLLGPYEKMSKKKLEEIEKKETIIKNDAILNKDQQKAFDEIVNSDEKHFLLYGITGSGKTEIYIKLIEEALMKDKSSIFLLPEISLSSQMVKRIKKVFGDNVSLVHSKMTSTNKLKEWYNIYSGNVKVILGTRSALFAPVKNLGYIIIDEEHENAYKQEDNARYHARNVAIKRAMEEGAKVVLGSATPSFESYYLAKNNFFKLVKINNRYNNSELPDIEIVDLSNEKSLLSEKLLLNIKEVISKGEQVILILNRKSHSVLVKCKDCSTKISCPRCSLNLRYSKSKNILECSHCEYRRKMYDVCPNCKSEKLEYLGIGIEKIEEELANLFGNENILRMDSSTMTSQKDFDKAYKEFSENKYQIAIGTQILAKGFHFPNVTLVGVINTDQILSLSDFRVGEKTFQLVTQSAGRAGRGDKKGKVILQSYVPDSKLIQSIVSNNFDEYFQYDLELRRFLNLPPFSRMIKIIVSDKKEARSYKKISEIYEELLGNFENISHIEKAPIYKLNDDYRYNIFIKTNKAEIDLNKKLLIKIKSLSTSTTRVLVDVDPITLY